MTKTTDIVYVIDRSDSMERQIEDAVGGFNTFIKEQQAIPGGCYVTLVAFDEVVETIYARIPLANVPELAVSDIPVRGLTALYDAVGISVSALSDSWNVIVCVMTDGYDNYSSEWTSRAIKKLVERKQNAGWEFRFIGVGIDAFTMSGGMGFKDKQVSNVTPDKQGLEDYRDFVSKATTAYRVS